MARLVIPVALGLTLGWAASHVLLLGWWTPVPWGVASLALGDRETWGDARQPIVAAMLLPDPRLTLSGWGGRLIGK